MNKKTRIFMVGSASTLAAGLCIGLAAYFGGFPTGAFSRAVGPDELNYVPADAALVAYANVRDVMNSEFRQRLRQVMPDQDKGKNDFEEKTGIDIDTDLDHVVAYVRAGESVDTGAVVLARGRFNDARLEALARQHGGEITEYKGKRLVRSPREIGVAEEPARPAIQGHPVIAFLEPGLVAIGDEVSVHSAIDTREGAPGITSNTEIASLMTDAQGGGNAWAVGRFDVLTSRANLPEQVTRQLPPIKTFAAVGHINGGVSGTFRAEARDEQSANNLRDVVRGFLALAKMQAGSKPEFQTLADSLQLGGTGTTVALSFTIPSAVLDVIVPKTRTDIQ